MQEYSSTQTKRLRTFTFLILLHLSDAVCAHNVVWVWLQRPSSWDKDMDRFAEAQARADIANGHMRIFDFGLEMPNADYDHLLFKYGLEEVNQGCIPVDYLEVFGKAYGKVIDAELERRYGKDFWNRFDAELANLQASHVKRIAVGRK